MSPTIALERTLLDARQAARRPATAGTEAEQEDALEKLDREYLAGQKRHATQEGTLNKKHGSIKESEEQLKQAKEWDVEKEVVTDSTKA